MTFPAAHDPMARVAQGIVNREDVPGFVRQSSQSAARTATASCPLQTARDIITAETSKFESGVSIYRVQMPTCFGLLGCSTTGL